MASAEKTKSARKLFQVSKAKNTITALYAADEERVDEEIDRIFAAFSKSFGEKAAGEMLEEAIKAADEQMSSGIKQSMVEGAKARIAQG